MKLLLSTEISNIFDFRTFENRHDSDISQDGICGRQRIQIRDHSDDVALLEGMKSVTFNTIYTFSMNLSAHQQDTH